MDVCNFDPFVPWLRATRWCMNWWGQRWYDGHRQTPTHISINGDCNVGVCIAILLGFAVQLKADRWQTANGSSWVAMCIICIAWRRLVVPFWHLRFLSVPHISTMTKMGFRRIKLPLELSSRNENWVWESFFFIFHFGSLVLVLCRSAKCVCVEIAVQCTEMHWIGCVTPCLMHYWLGTECI